MTNKMVTMALHAVCLECVARILHAVTWSLCRGKLGKEVVPCRRTKGRSWPSRTCSQSSHMDMLQMSVEMIETNLSVVFLPYNLPFPVCPLYPLGGALLATAVWPWNQVAFLKLQPVLCAHRSNSAATSLCILETLAGRDPLPAAPNRTSLPSP